MKKISKLMVLLMVTIMVVGSLAACGKKDDKKPADTTKNESNDSKDDKKDDDAAPVDEAPAEATPVTLKVWCPENQVQNGTMDAMAASFQELHPEWDITFTIEVVGEDVAKEQIGRAHV